MKRSSIQQNLNSIYIVISCALSVLLLSACGSTSPTSRAPVISTPSIGSQPEVIEEAETPEALLNRAQSEWQETGNMQARNTLLMRAADGYAAMQECTKALTVVNKIYAELLSNRNKQYAKLLLAECATAEQLDLAQRAELVARPLASPSLRDRQRRIQAQIFAQQKQWLAAAQSLSQLSQIDADIATLIWSWLQQVDYAEQRAAINRYPNLRLWLAVSTMLHRYGTQPDNLSENFAQFITENPDHPLVSFPPREMLAGMAVTTRMPTEIAVVLPLTGRLAAQGNAIKQGILSAYFSELDVINESRIQFHDSNILSIDELAIELENAELVIGPLLKTTIESLAPKLSPSTVMVALNRIDASISAEPIVLDTVNSSAELEAQPIEAERFYFALAPEDEAEQMAKHIYQQGYRTPILVHAQDAIGQRLSAAFLSAWRELNQQNSNDGISVVSYSDNDGMRDGVTSALDVAQSKNRIKQLERLLVPELYNVPRNRRDVDAIVAFATPEQTELLNPIVEASLSPFTDKNVPVYVTSRSISLNVTKNQLRDLQNVHFIDLPWMMPNHPWQTMAEQVNTLYPNQRDSLKRLFALGFDAYNQILVLPHLAAIPQLKAPALSGVLSVNNQHQVIRSLPMAIIDNEEIKVLVEP